MAILSKCWLMIESIVIQDGFLKYYHLKLFMHPLVLFLCQLLIWLSLFFLWLLPPFKAFFNTSLSVLILFSKLFSRFLQVIIVRRKVTCNTESRKGIKNSLNNLQLSRRIHKPVPAFSFSFKHQVDSQLKVLLAMQEGKFSEEEDEDNLFHELIHEDLVEGLQEEDEDNIFYEFDHEEVLERFEEEEEEHDIIVDALNMEKSLELDNQTMPLGQEDENFITDEEEDSLNSYMENDVTSPVASDKDDQSSSLSIRSLDSSALQDSIVMENDVTSLVASDRDDHSSSLSIRSLDTSTLEDSIVMENQRQHVEDDEIDQVYKNYCERMRWYDILSRDRTYGLSVIKNQQTASSLSLWGETAEKRLKQSIKKDLELVYVAQSCLSWEALQHQYIIVRDSSKLTDSRGRFYDNDVTREFQNFQVLLERFLEDEKCEGKRVLSFVQRRLELMNFFQVPRLSGYNREGHNEGGEEERQKKQVLKVIERCIEVFNDFVRVDIKKPLIWDRLKLSLTSSPLMELEDPRDFKLFLDLKTSLQKKEQFLKEMQGKKKKIWFKKKSSNMEADMNEKDEDFMLMRFMTIDLKLVSRVLHMSLVSSSHLKWCQHKLNNIHFNGDKVSRTLSPVLFPSS